ncbi:MAG: ABC transporter ATP-binding protein [Actinomycetes bacterium]
MPAAVPPSIPPDVPPVVPPAAPGFPTSLSPEPAVRVEQLLKAYDGRPVVDDLDLVAQMGQVTAVLGPNGAGKTTTVEICEGLRTPDSGMVRVLGRSPADPWLRSRVGVMLQEGGVYGTVSARDALRHAAALYRTPHDPESLMAALGLSDVATVPNRRLSGGQRQRLALALAIVGRPLVVFLDEPTAGLDPHSRRTVWELIKALRQAGVGVLLTTHYLDEAEQLADHVVIVDHGRAIAAGPPSDLIAYATRGSRSRLRFTAAVALDLGILISSLPAGSTAQEISPGTYEVRAPGVTDALSGVSAWCTTMGVTLTSISSDRRTLEDVFLELTAEDRT